MKQAFLGRQEQEDYQENCTGRTAKNIAYHWRGKEQQQIGRNCGIRCTKRDGTQQAAHSYSIFANTIHEGLKTPLDTLNSLELQYEEE